MASCTCERKNASRTAKSTGTGASSKVVATSTDVSCNAKCSISAKSTTARKPRGAARSTYCKPIPAQSRWRCFPRTVKPQSSIVKWSKVKLNEIRLHRPRQWGACWLALKLWEQLELDRFWQQRLPMSRQGTKWLVAGGVGPRLIIANECLHGEVAPHCQDTTPVFDTIARAESMRDRIGGFGRASAG